MSDPSALIADGHARWGSGYEANYDRESGHLTSVKDGFGRPVPPEEWAEFEAYQTAVADSWREGAIEANEVRQRAFTVGYLP